MIDRECKICKTFFVVTSISNKKIYCTRKCKSIADKQRLKVEYDLNPEKFRSKGRETYYKNHEENKIRSKERAKRERKLNPSLFKYQKLQNTYGLSAEEYSTMLTSQHNKCLICFREISGELNTKNLKAFVDHNHKTGLVRGVLCINCNSILGYSREDKGVLLAAIEYLKTFSKE